MPNDESDFNNSAKHRKRTTLRRGGNEKHSQYRCDACGRYTVDADFVGAQLCRSGLREADHLRH